MNEFVLKEKAEIHLPPSAQHPVISEIIKGYTAGIDWEILFDAEENTVVIGSSALPETADEDFVLNINENGMAIAGKDHASTLRGLFDFLDIHICASWWYISPIQKAMNIKMRNTSVNCKL